MKLKKDRNGAFTLISIAIIVVILIIAAVAVAFVYMNANWPRVEQGDLDPNDPDPVIGYLTASCTVLVDNRQALAGFLVSVSAYSAELVLNPPTQEMWGLDLSAHELDGFVEFRISNPALLFDTLKVTAPWHIGVGGALDAQNYISKVVTMPGTFAMKYHGTYSMTVKVLASDGTTVLDQETKNVVI